MVIMRNMMLSMHSTMAGIFAQMDSSSENSTAMGHAFDDAKNDDSFYIPPDVFKNKDFKRAMNSFLSSDGHAARFIILHRGDPATTEGMESVDAIHTAAEEALKVTPLEDAKIYLYGTAAIFKDFAAGAQWDLLIAGVSSLCLVFVIMLVLTRALIAAAAIVGTVALSLGASFGLSVLVLAVPARYPTALAGAGDVGHRVVGGGIRLQPAAGLPVPGGGPCRIEDRHHPRHGRYRKGRDERWTGVRVHDGVHGRQRSDE